MLDVKGEGRVVKGEKERISFDLFNYKEKACLQANDN